MAESGQTDDNRVLPGAGTPPKIDRRPEWKVERARMRAHIVTTQMSGMTYEDLSQIARGSMNDRYMFIPDNDLITAYEKAGGKWTEIMLERYKNET